LKEAGMITFTSVEAQNNFGKLLDTVQRETVAVTRHGRPTAFIVSPKEMEELLDARRRRGKATAELEAWSRQAEQRATSAGSQLTDEAVGRMVHQAR
jgi:antitoxin Phd